MMRKQLVMLVVLAAGCASAAMFNVKDFGALGDGATLDTKSLQAAVDACTKAGGGTVRVPAGGYVTGTLELKSNVTLSLDYGASILGSQNLADYPIDKIRAAREGNSECLLYAADASNITIEGLGVIDGRGTPDAFPKYKGSGREKTKLPRPRLVRFENCKNLTFSGLTYMRPAFWGIHLIDCDGVHFNAVTVRMRNNNVNNDGLDIDGCENVLIENCDIDSGDDAICLKSSKNPCRNITVRNCKVASNTAALKFGTSSSGGFINVDVSNCYFYNCPMGAIKLQSVDGGRIENINISRIVMDEVGAPIFIRLGNRGRIYTRNTYTGTKVINGDKSEGAGVGSIKGIRISDIVANVVIEDREKAATAHYKNMKVDTTPGVTDKEKAKAGPIMIAGIPGHYIEDIVLENITISYPGHGTDKDTKGEILEDITRYPEQFFFGVLPSWGAYIRHAKNIEFKNVTMTTREPDARQKIVLDDVDGFVEK